MSPLALPHGAARRAAPSLAHALVVLLIFSLQFGPMVGLLGFRVTESPAWTLLSIVRDILVLLLVLLAFSHVAFNGRRGALPASGRWALVMVVAFVGLGLLSSAESTSLALNLRRQLLVPLLFVAVLLLPWSTRQLRDLAALVVGSSVAVAAFGIVEVIVSEPLWVDLLDLQGFNSANPLDPFGHYAFAESGRAFTWDFEVWAGRPLRRAMSTYLEPTTLAAGLAAALALMLAERRWHPRRAGTLALWLVFLCGVMTLAKSFLLYLLVLLSWRLFGLPSPRQVIGLTVLGVLVAFAAESAGLVDGPFAHIAGLATGVRYLAEGGWLGEGLGMAGNYVLDGEEAGAESGLGNVIVQAGIAALIPLLWVRSIAIDVERKARALRDPGGRWLATWLLFWFVSFLFSASSLGVGGNSLGFILLAVYLHPAYRP